MLTKFQGGQEVTPHHFLKLYLLIRYFTKTGPNNVIRHADSYEVHPSILTACDRVSEKGLKGRIVSTAGNNPTEEILVLRVYGMIRCHVHYPVSARYTNGLL